MIQNNAFANTTNEITTINIEEVSGDLNQAVEIGVNIAHPMEMCGGLVEIDYNPHITVVESVKQGDALASFLFVPNLNQKESGKIIVGWAGTTGIENDGELFTMTFRLKKAGTSELKISHLELNDEAGNIIETNDVNGRVTVGEKNTASNNSSTTDQVANHVTNNGSSEQSTSETKIEIDNKNEINLEDIKNHWAENDIRKLVELKIIAGDPDGNFRPEDSITREELTKLIVLAAGLTPDTKEELDFNDVSQISEWAKGYVAVAVKNEIINGYEDHTFQAKKKVTRAEISAMIARVLKANNSTNVHLSFKDIQAIPAWALPYIEKAVNQEIINGFPDGSFCANLSTTRAQAAKMIARMLQ